MVGRNDPCPCGSGRKYKKCCLLKSPGQGKRISGNFLFEPGSYFQDESFIPLLACVEELSVKEKGLQFVLVNPSKMFTSKSEAVNQAIADYTEVCRVDDATGSIETMGRQLAVLGYEISNVKNVAISH